MRRLHYINGCGLAGFNKYDVLYPVQVDCLRIIYLARQLGCPKIVLDHIRMHILCILLYICVHHNA